MENQIAKINPKDIKWNDLDKMQLTKQENRDLRNFILNQKPASSWIKKHPLYKNDYLPIDKVEYLLTVFFKVWRVEVKQVYHIANSICVNVRLYYQDVDSAEMNWQDGVGAAPMQVDSGSKAMDSTAIKSNAVMLALPIAETNAVKDAADKIGKIFGRDLNRKDTLDYDVLIKNFDGAKLTEK